jgi:hypothetical protein
MNICFMVFQAVFVLKLVETHLTFNNLIGFGVFSPGMVLNTIFLPMFKCTANKMAFELVFFDTL